MFEGMKACAKRHSIDFQVEVMGGNTGTDADGVAVAGVGVRCALVSVPLRYMHTPAELIDARDVEQTAALIAAYVTDEFGGGTLMLYENIERLSALPGVSGREEAVRAALLELLDGRCDCKVDALGNLLAFKRGAKKPANRLMLSAHMDEVGLIVTYIEDSGLLRFAGRRRDRPPYSRRQDGAHRKDARRDRYKGDASEIGRGARKSGGVRCAVHRYRRENAPRGSGACQPGRRAVFDSRYALFGDGFLRGRALDDRVGCALLVELLLSEQLAIRSARRLHGPGGNRHDGAKTAAAQICPDIAIAVETTTACDIPGTPPEKTVCSLKKGPVISFMDGEQFTTRRCTRAQCRLLPLPGSPVSQSRAYSAAMRRVRYRQRATARVYWRCPSVQISAYAVMCCQPLRY